MRTPLQAIGKGTSFPENRPFINARILAQVNISRTLKGRGDSEETGDWS
jgi:hypothetical protein